jgi:hypothetical protein
MVGVFHINAELQTLWNESFLVEEVSSAGGRVNHQMPSRTILKNYTLHFCQKRSLELPTGNITVGYECAGEEYERYAKKLLAFAENTTLHT